MTLGKRISGISSEGNNVPHYALGKRISGISSEGNNVPHYAF